MDGELLDRARGVDFCARRGIILRGSISVGTENQWRDVLAYATPAERDVLTGYVRAAEIQQAHDRAWQDEFEAARAARDAPMSDAEQAAVNQDRIEALAAAQDAQRPATRAQLDDLISLQRDILAALTKR